MTDPNSLLPPFLRSPTNPVTAGMPSAANTQDLTAFDGPRSPTVPATCAPGHLNGDQFTAPPLPSTGHTPGTQDAAMARMGLTAQAQQHARAGLRNTGASMRSDMSDLTASNRAGLAAARATVSAPWTPAGHAPGSTNQGFPLAPPNPANRVPRPGSDPGFPLAPPNPANRVPRPGSDPGFPLAPPNPANRVPRPGGPAAPPPPAAPPQVPAGGAPSALPGVPGVPGAPGAGAPQHPAFGPQFKLHAAHAVVSTLGKVIKNSAGAASAPKTMVRQTGGWQHS